MTLRMSLGGLLVLACVSMAGAADEGVEILNADSYWRWHVTLRGADERTETGELKPLAGQSVDRLTSAAPPAGWTAADFDDADWPRSRPSWLRELACGRYSSAVVSLRGKFRVTDPAAVKSLTLTCAYYGGARVLLNGAEIARGHVADGPLTPETCAADYGEESFLDAEGKPLGSDYRRSQAPPDQRKLLNERVATRQRQLGPVALPIDKLRKGVNVLAIEVRRSPYHPIVHQWYTRHRNLDAQWHTIDIRGIHLRAAGGGIEPNTARPEGLQVWNHDRNDRVTSVDYGDPCEPLRPVRIVAARNGSYCAQIVLGSTAPIERPVAVAGDLKPAAGGKAIPAGRVAVLYGRMDWGGRNYPKWCDSLTPTPPERVAADKAAGAVLPIVFRVRVDADAAPGDYRGNVQVVTAARSAPTLVPIELHVSGWAAPRAVDYRTYIGIYQSPTSLSLQYGVPEWSDRHWELMDRSFAMLARTGNRLVNVFAVEQTQFGNDRGMIYWVKQPDGSYQYDFSVFDRFMAMAVRHCPKLDYVAIHVWHSGGWETRQADQKNTVTVLGPKTGEFSRMQVPVFGTAESKAFWKPVLDAIRARLEKLHLAEAMCLGILSDGTAPPEVFRAFDEITPGGAKWMRGLHRQDYSAKPYPLRGGGKVVLHEYCYGLGLPDPAKGLPPVHTYRGRPGTAYHRIAGHETAATLIWYRTFPEQSLFRGTQGVGRICLDFWPVLKGERGGSSSLYNRYPHSSCAQRQPSLEKMTWAAPDGAETTVRFEAFCEGAQDAGAVIVLSEAVGEHADRLGPELTARCRQVLIDRLNYCRFWDQMLWAHTYFHMHHYGWQDMARRLYDCAAEVSRNVCSSAAHEEPQR